ncbi:MAG: 50S ribosomal protein L10 [Lachnospiraceae bacterium]|nr:50S ribosomal protein L10 [Lachnospiraceae bacterium]
MAKVELKQPIVQEIGEQIKDAQSVLLVQYLGLTVEQDTAMRKELREAGVAYKVYKNTMMNLAFKGTDCEPLVEKLEGPNALAIHKEDPTAAARILAKYAKQYKCFNMIAGIVEGKYVEGEALDEVSRIPTRDELLARLFGSMQSPIANFARVIKQIAEKDGEAAPAAEAAPAEA